MRDSMDRRYFLKVSAAGTGMALAFSLCGSSVLAESSKSSSGGSPGQNWPPDAWIRIAPDNMVTLIIGKSEMGQGTWTGLAMIMGDELDVDWDQIRVEAAPARAPYRDPLSGMQITGGSTGIRNMIAAMSWASAAAREMLIEAAALEWKVPVTECKTSHAMVIHQASGRKLTYGDLASKAATLPVPMEPKLKPPDQLQFVGKSMPRLDSSDKINGKGVFGTDVFVPGMLYSALARPMAYGAKLESCDKDAALKVPGVKKVVEVTDGVAVLATGIEAAFKGRDALNPRWSPGSMPNLNDKTLDEMFSNAMSKKGLVTKNTGDAQNGLEKAAKKLSAEYSVPFAAHATIEPHNCVAHVQADSCQIWVPTQFQTAVLDTAVKETGLPADKIDVHTTMLGGGFGGKSEVRVVAEAVRISRAAGTPVKHVWTRAEDFRNDCFRPGSLHRIEAGLDHQGRLDVWRHKVVTLPIMERILPAYVQGGIDSSAVDGIWNTEYDISNLLVEWVRLDVPIPAGFWRSVGNSSNTFVVESFIDELAHLDGKDPLEFRIRMIKDQPRAIRCLQKVAEAGNWGKTAPKGRGRGIAQRYCFGTYCAQLAEVSVDENSGAIKVHKMVVALDPGKIVNPDSVVAQIEGGVVQAISVALKERISFANGGVATANFSGYPLLTMSETPEIEAHLITKNDKMGGIGEPPIPPVAPAIANAVFAATGVRLRKMPITPENVLSAMKEQRNNRK